VVVNVGIMVCVGMNVRVVDVVEVPVCVPVEVADGVCVGMEVRVHVPEGVGVGV
jgi:hypothetical protein